MRPSRHSFTILALCSLILGCTAELAVAQGLPPAPSMAGRPSAIGQGSMIGDLLPALGSQSVGPGNAPIGHGTSGKKLSGPALPTPPAQGKVLLPGTTPLGSSRLGEIAQLDTPSSDTKLSNGTATLNDDERRHKSSDLELVLSGRIEDNTPRELSQFGYDVLDATSKSFIQPESIPVHDDYRLGAGDEIVLSLSGMVDDAWILKVSREGTITVPRVGQVTVSGLRWADLQPMLAKKLNQYFRISSGQVGLAITMNKLRMMPIYVVGAVHSPGTYQLSALSTVLHALYASGGIKKTGTLRAVRLIRANEPTKPIRVDLYDLLMNGARASDYTLQSGDTVFVPLIGNVVGISGHVKRPGIYELLGDTRLNTALAMAGGILPTGQTNRVQVERYVAHQKKIVIDANTTDRLNDSESVAMMNMDLVKVFAVNPILQDAVYLSGHVARNGPFQWADGMKVSHLVSWDTLLPMPYLEYARIVRDMLPDHRKAVIPFNLGRALAGDAQHDLALQPLDEIWIYSRVEIDRLPRINVFGEVKQPGPYYLLEGLRISDLIYNAGGFTPLASLKDAELTRYTINSRTNEVTLTHQAIDVEAAMNNDPQHNMLLQAYDAITIKAIPDAKIGATITLTGEVKFPGTYTIAPGDHLADVIERAGGYTDKAFLPGARLIRKSLAEEQQKQLDAFVLTQEQRLTSETAAIQAGGSLRKDEMAAEVESMAQRKDLLKKLAKQVVIGRMVVSLDQPEKMRATWKDLQLEPGDQLTIPMIPSSVGVIGSVYSQATFLYEPGKSGSYYLKRAGGLLEDANKKAIYVVKADGSALQADDAFSQIQAGDVIIVPPSTDGKIRPSAFARDLASILGSMAITSAALIRIF